MPKKQKNMDGQLQSKSSYWPFIFFIAGLLYLIWAMYFTLQSKFIPCPNWYQYQKILALILTSAFFLGLLYLQRKKTLPENIFSSHKFFKLFLKWLALPITLGLITMAVIEANFILITQFFGKPASYYYTMEKHTAHRRYSLERFYQLKLKNTPNWNFAILISEDTFNQLPQSVDVYLEGTETTLGFTAERYKVIDLHQNN